MSRAGATPRKSSRARLPATVLVAGAAMALLGVTTASPAAAQTTHLVVISGLAGEPRYREAFHASATAMLDAARGSGVASADIRYLAADPDLDPERIAARSTRDNIEQHLGELASRAGPDDNVLVLLIGHGSARGEESALNLPGPDISGSQLAVMLSPFTTQTVAVVNTASASGGFVAALSGQKRVVVTATRSSRERNETRFARHFVAAYAENAADVDKDGRVSVLEAFAYAQREVERAYEAENLLQTEHALLDDNGDGEGSLSVDADSGDGVLARRFFLSSGPVVASGDPDLRADPELAALYRSKQDLEERIEALRAVKDQLDPDDYETRLEDLLVELALTDRDIRQKEGGGS